MLTKKLTGREISFDDDGVYPGDIAKDIGVKGDVVFCDIKVALQQYIRHQSARVPLERNCQFFLSRNFVAFTHFAKPPLHSEAA